MAINPFLEAVGSQFHELKSYLWKDQTAARLEKKAGRLSQALRQCYPTLIHHRSVLEGGRRHLAENEKRVAHLTARVETYLHVADLGNAWRNALELEQAHHALRQVREKLQQQEKAYRNQQARIDLIKGRLTDLHEQISFHRQWRE